MRLSLVYLFSNTQLSMAFYTTILILGCYVKKRTRDFDKIENHFFLCFYSYNVRMVHIACAMWQWSKQKKCIVAKQRTTTKTGDQSKEFPEKKNTHNWAAKLLNIMWKCP